MSTRDVYILRTGAEEDAEGQIYELLFTTDTKKLLVRSGADSFAAFPSNQTTGEFSYDENLVFLGLNIGSGSAINGTVIGAQEAAAGNFTNITLNNAASNNSILQLKSTSVSHSHSNMDDANTYGQFLRVDQENGGLLIKGATETGVGLALEATALLSSVSSDQDSTGRGIIELVASATSGGDLVDISGSENVIAVMKRNANDTLSPVAFLTAEGDWVLAGTSQNEVLDDYDDVKLVEGLRAMLSVDPEVKKQFSDSIDYATPVLKQNGIIQVSRDGNVVNFSTKNALVLLMDAIRQLKMLLDPKTKIA